MPTRCTEALHWNRWSASETRYFVTCCTRLRRPGLHRAAIGSVVRQAIHASDVAGDTSTAALPVMPEHLHWLFCLGSRLTLGRVIARFKASTRGSLASHALEWQRDFFEHRLRSEESVEDYGRYIFLNPYRAGLLSSESVWDGWWSPRPEVFRFTSLLSPNGAPPRERIVEAISRLAVGE